MKKPRTLHCSFCRKPDAQVAKLVAGQGVFICDECVAVADRLMRSPGDPPPAPQTQTIRQRALTRLRRWFGGTPAVPYAP